MSALPPKADLFQHWRLGLVLTLSGHSLTDIFGQIVDYAAGSSSNVVNPKVLEKARYTEIR